MQYTLVLLNINSCSEQNYNLRMYQHGLTVLEFLEQLMGARNRVGIGLSYRPARLHRLVESIPGLLKRLQIRAQVSVCPPCLVQQFYSCMFMAGVYTHA